MQSLKEGVTEICVPDKAITRRNHAVKSNLQPGDTVTATPTEMIHQPSCTHKQQFPLHNVLDTQRCRSENTQVQNGELVPHCATASVQPYIPQCLSEWVSNRVGQIPCEWPT